MAFIWVFKKKKGGERSVYSTTSRRFGSHHDRQKLPNLFHWALYLRESWAFSGGPLAFTDCSSTGIATKPATNTMLNATKIAIINID